MTDLERELLYRLLDANTGAGNAQHKLYIGELPPEFPLDLPEGVRLLGSSEQTFPKVPSHKQGMWRQNHTRVLLDSALPVAEFIAQMRQHLSSGWEDADWPPAMRHQGFLPAEPQDSLGVYHSALEKMLSVQALEVSGNTQVTLDLNDHSSDDFAQMRRHFTVSEQQLASVRVPAGAAVQFVGGSSGSDHASCEALIESSLSAGELLDHFSPQLLAQGWQLLSRTHAQAVTATSWTDEQGGIVFITLQSVPEGFSATMLVTGRQSGQSSSSSSYSI